jgi:hypothetical protein
VKIFVSWSKELSKDVAKLLKEWLPKVIQSVEVFISTEIIKGVLWSDEIQKQLNGTKMGILCVTERNKNEPWLLFEAGGISMYSRKVCTLLIDLSSEDMVLSPLHLFNATKIDKSDMYLLIKTINEEAETSLSENRLEDSFNTHWDEFEKKFDEIILKNKSNNEEKEILNTVSEPKNCKSEKGIKGKPRYKMLPQFFEIHLIRPINIQISYARTCDNYTYIDIEDFGQIPIPSTAIRGYNYGVGKPDKPDEHGHACITVSYLPDMKEYAKGFIDGYNTKFDVFIDTIGARKETVVNNALKNFKGFKETHGTSNKIELNDLYSEGLYEGERYKAWEIILQTPNEFAQYFKKRE